MPSSKHRRKPGGKAVAHPGRNKYGRFNPPAWFLFLETYNRPFHKKFGYGKGPDGGEDPPHDSGHMLDLVANHFIDGEKSVGKDGLFSEFCQTIIDDEYDPPKITILTPEMAEAALQFLADQEMVIVDGEMVSIHPRFSHLQIQGVTQPPISQGLADPPKR